MPHHHVRAVVPARRARRWRPAARETGSAHCPTCSPRRATGCPASRSMRSATPFNATRLPWEIPERTPLQAGTPASAREHRPVRQPRVPSTISTDPVEIAEPKRRAALERGVRLRQPGEQRRGDLGHQRARLVEPFGRDGSASAAVPGFEEALKHFVNEAPSRTRRHRRLVLRGLLETKDVGREELEWTVLIAFERTQRRRPGRQRVGESPEAQHGKPGDTLPPSSHSRAEHSSGRRIDRVVVERLGFENPMRRDGFLDGVEAGLLHFVDRRVDGLTRASASRRKVETDSRDVGSLSRSANAARAPARRSDSTGQPNSRKTDGE